MPLAIGAVLPNCDYGRYLPERIASILGQDRAPEELVFLDDASVDGSWDIAAPLLSRFSGRLRTHRNEVRSGSVLGQWRRGVEAVTTELVWIAEADDRASPGLLAALAARLDADPEAILAFCDSAAIDTDGHRLAADSQDYYRDHDGWNPLAADCAFTAEDALRRLLCPRNLILNASAVLWRTAALRRALQRMETETARWLAAGDWRAYAEACAAGGTVHFLAEPLNEHRRHGGSVGGRLGAARRYAEVVAMLAVLRDRLGADPARDAAMRRHLADLRQLWALEPAG